MVAASNVPAIGLKKQAMREELRAAFASRRRQASYCGQGRAAKNARATQVQNARIADAT